MKPKQFNFQIEWNKSVMRVRENPRVAAELDGVCANHENVAYSIYQDLMLEDPIKAEIAYDLDIDTIRAKRWDLSWHRQDDEACLVVDWALAIANAVYPKQRWIKLEAGQVGHDIVTNSNRTMVFDLLHFDKISGGAALYLAGDKHYKATREEKLEAIDFLERRAEKDRAFLSSLREYAAITSAEAQTVVAPMS